MPRYPTKSAFPPLEELLPEFAGLKRGSSKLCQIAELLVTLILAHRTTKNLTFYSTRELARFFGTSQNTAALVVKHLEGEGFVRRVRGSQTLVLGTQVVTRSRIQAVAGLMLWDFTQRFSETHMTLVRQLGDELRPHHIALEVIPHFDLGDQHLDMNVLLRRHALDFMIWPFPFRHHHDVMLRLQDRGTRNLVIGLDTSPLPFTRNIIVDFPTAYGELLDYWKDKHGIQRVLVVKPREFTPRNRINVFHQLALKMGFDCQVVSSDYTLPAEVLTTEKERIGIALLDEHSTAEFIFYDPPSFIKVARQHRVLFGNGSVNVPFVPNGELRVDRIFVRDDKVPDERGCSLCTAITQKLVQWCAGDFSAPAIHVPAQFWDNGKLWRYL